MFDFLKGQMKVAIFAGHSTSLLQRRIQSERRAKREVVMILTHHKSEAMDHLAAELDIPLIRFDLGYKGLHQAIQATIVFYRVRRIVVLPGYECWPLDKSFDVTVGGNIIQEAAAV